MLKHALVLFILAGALFGTSGCSETAGSGVLVSIPPVSFSCNTANCLSPGPNRQFRVIYSEFNCSGAGQVSFYAKRSAASFSLSCNGASCSGTANSWIDENGNTTTQIPANNYTVCVVIFTHGTIAAGPTAQDAWGQTSQFAVSEGSSVPAISFYDGVPTLALY